MAITPQRECGDGCYQQREGTEGEIRGKWRGVGAILLKRGTNSAAPGEMTKNVDLRCHAAAGTTCKEAPSGEDLTCV